LIDKQQGSEPGGITDTAHGAVSALARRGCRDRSLGRGAYVALHHKLIWPVVVVAPLLCILFLRMGCDLAEALILMAIVGVSLALSLPGEVTHCYPGRQNRADGRPPVSARTATPTP
jgi:hypothetical protein